MALPINILEQFKQITRVDLSDYLDNYTDFIQNRSRNIVDLYNGTISVIDTIAFEQLDSLYQKSTEIEGIVETGKHNMSYTAAFWELLELLTDMKTSLLSLRNARKWTRSSITKAQVSGGIRTEVGLKKFQTIEALASSIGATNRDTYWLKIAFDNDLTEEQYTSEGGVLLSVKGVNKRGMLVNSVMDTDISGEKIYGKDILKKITFNDQEDDLEILSYKQTLLQTVETLVLLKRGDNPEFENEGIQSTLINGNNRASIPFPIILRQYYYTFSQDDSFKSILIKDIKFNQDYISLTVECETRIGEIVPQIFNS